MIDMYMKVTWRAVINMIHVMVLLKQFGSLVGSILVHVFDIEDWMVRGRELDLGCRGHIDELKIG